MFMQVGISSCLPRHFTRGGAILAVDPRFGCEVMTTPPSKPDKRLWNYLSAKYSPRFCRENGGAIDTKKEQSCLSAVHAGVVLIVLDTFRVTWLYRRTCLASRSKWFNDIGPESMSFSSSSVWQNNSELTTTKIEDTRTAHSTWFGSCQPQKSGRWVTFWIESTILCSKMTVDNATM